MTKSINIKLLAPEYTEAVENMWKASMDMLTFSSNTLGEIYRISAIVRLVAKNKAKVDGLRQLCAEGTEKGDLHTLNRVAYLAERMQEEKCFDQLWTTVSSQYDRFIQSYAEMQQNDNIVLEIPTSEEILAQCYQSMEESEANKLKLAIETAKALIAL